MQSALTGSQVPKPEQLIVGLQYREQAVIKLVIGSTKSVVFNVTFTVMLMRHRPSEATMVPLE